MKINPPASWPDSRALRASVAAMAVLMALTAGCSSAHPPASAGRQLSAHRDTIAIWDQFASCARSHGIPGLPDPTVDSQGNVSFPGANTQNDWNHPTDVPSVQQACGPLLDQLPGASPSAAPPNPAQFRILLSFAACMRQHGITDWPDPDANGRFPLDQHLQALGKRGVYPQLQHCEQANPGVRALLQVIQGP
jgi:hypothetical protein